MTSENVLNFWFKELTPKDWFMKSDDLDTKIKNQFGKIHKMAIAGELYTWRSTPEGRVAEIIVLDQFSRNMFRNMPESFLYDSQALVLAQECISLGLDKELPLDYKRFLYMPYMHSESALIHEEAVRLFSQQGLEENLEFEHKHFDIIKKFGRYPHRNEILKRDSTKEELEFLKGPNSSF